MQRDIIIGAVIVFAAIVTATTLVVRDRPQSTTIVIDRARAPRRTVSVDPPRQIPPQVQRVVPQSQGPVIPVAPPTPATVPAAAGWTGTPQGRRGQAQAAPIDEPKAREALGWVGADPEADEVYIAAINDPNLAPNARRNLIEDLNETGFSNPRNLTQDDLPVIEYRLAMIDQLAPNAMDEINAAAFQEARKDLVNMRTRIVGQ